MSLAEACPCVLMWVCVQSQVITLKGYRKAVKKPMTAGIQATNTRAKMLFAWVVSGIDDSNKYAQNRLGIPDESYMQIENVAGLCGVRCRSSKQNRVRRGKEKFHSFIFLSLWGSWGLDVIGAPSPLFVTRRVNFPNYWEVKRSKYFRAEYSVPQVSIRRSILIFRFTFIFIQFFYHDSIVKQTL